MQTVFITGGTGYIGTRLIKALLADGNFHIKALTRKGSENKLPKGCEIIYADALNADSYKNSIAPAAIFVHLIGVAHPSPAKAEQFRKIDLISVQQAAKAAATAGIKHFIYLSVAMYPTTIMKDYQEVRARGETILLQQHFTCSFIRPWYVLGPGHWWPLLLKPFYWLAKFIPSKREAAKQLGTVTIKQMIETIVYAIKNQPPVNTVYDVSKIKIMTNKELVQTAFDNFSKGNIPAILDLLSDDVTWKMNGPADIFPYAGTRKGKAEVLDFFAQLGATSDFQVFQPKEYIAEGDKVVALGEAVATNKQTGKTSQNQWAMYWTFNNGKVTYYQNFSDTYDIAQSFIK